MSKQANITFRLDDNLKDDFYQHLENKGVTFSKWIRSAMKKEMDGVEINKELLDEFQALLEIYYEKRRDGGRK